MHAAAYSLLILDKALRRPRAGRAATNRSHAGHGGAQWGLTQQGHLLDGDYGYYAKSSGGPPCPYGRRHNPALDEYTACGAFAAEAKEGKDRSGIEVQEGRY